MQLKNGLIPPGEGVAVGSDEGVSVGSGEPVPLGRLYYSFILSTVLKGHNKDNCNQSRTYSVVPFHLTLFRGIFSPLKDWES